VRLQKVTEPDYEPVTIAEAKAQVRVTHTEEDAWFRRQIRAARRAAQAIQWRAYNTQTFAILFDCLPELPISFPRGPLVSVEHVYTYDVDNVQTDVALSTFQIDVDSQPGRMAFANGGAWSSTTVRSLNAVRIEFTAGYGANPEDQPEDIRDAILLYVAHAYENRAGEFDVPKQFRDILAPNKLYQ